VKQLLCIEIALFILVSCGGKLPETRFYQLAAPTTPAKAGDLVIALEPFETDAGYDDERIVYRTTPYRLDYYQYHRWSAAPGTLIGNFLEQALERSGQFRNIARETSDRAPVVVRGRVLAIEEIDTSKTKWEGRLVIELALIDVKTGEALWSEQFEETEPLTKQSPEGLAQALSIAMTRIAQRATPAIADHTRRHNQALTSR
jgi:ABC-type uncharacterized transport system auxiliary subunit